MFWGFGERKIYEFGDDGGADGIDEMDEELE